jgi:predicted nucleotidyltransferase
MLLAARSQAGESQAMSRRRLETLIDQMVRRIADRFDPEQIILFGSAARGEAGPDSDVDLLVVMPVEGLKHKKQVQIRVALHDIRVPKDIIVTTPEDFEWRKEIPGTIEYPAVQEGKVLYARADGALV